MKIKRNLNIVSLNRFTESEKCEWLETNFQSSYYARGHESNYSLSNEELEIFLETFPIPQKREIIVKMTTTLENEQDLLSRTRSFIHQNKEKLSKFSTDSYTVKE